MFKVGFFFFPFLKVRLRLMTKHPDRMGKKSINCMNVVSPDSKHPATAEWPTSTFLSLPNISFNIWNYTDRTETYSNEIRDNIPEKTFC